MARVAERLLARAADVELHQRLYWSGCPVPQAEALRSADIRMSVLIDWVRNGLAAGRCMRTAQSEHIARGDTLAHTARATGVAPDRVLYVLTLAELPSLNGEVEPSRGQGA